MPDVLLELTELSSASSVDADPQVVVWPSTGIQITSESAVAAYPGFELTLSGSVQSLSEVTGEFMAVSVAGSIEIATLVSVEFDVWVLGGLEPSQIQAVSTVRLRRFDEWVNPAAAALHESGLISLELIDKLGQLSDWKFEANIGDRQDNVVWSGYGVEYLDSLSRTYNQQVLRNPRFNLRLDVTVRGFSSSWARINLTDIQNLRNAFVKYHGEVNRVDEWSNNL